MVKIQVSKTMYRFMSRQNHGWHSVLHSLSSKNINFDLEPSNPSNIQLCLLPAVLPSVIYVLFVSSFKNCFATHVSKTLSRGSTHFYALKLSIYLSIYSSVYAPYRGRSSFWFGYLEMLVNISFVPLWE